MIIAVELLDFFKRNIKNVDFKGVSVKYKMDSGKLLQVGYSPNGDGKLEFFYTNYSGEQSWASDIEYLYFERRDFIKVIFRK